jgi:hypothetical protein
MVDINKKRRLPAYKKGGCKQYVRLNIKKGSFYADKTKKGGGESPNG